MAGLREVFATFGVNVDASKLDDLNKKVDAGSSKLRAFVAAIGTGATMKAIFSFAEGLSEQGSAIKDNALKLGLSTSAYQELGYAAQVSGSNVETMTNGLQLLQDNLVTAATKGGDAAVAFTSLGIKVKDAHGNIRDTEAVMADAADAIAKMDSPAKQTAAAMNLFGKAGKQLLPVLKGGSKEINRLRAEAKELGGGFDEAAVAASDEFGDAMDRANLAVTSMRGKIATAMLPVLQRLVDGFTKAVAWFTRMAKNSKIVEVALIALGVAVAAFAVKAVIAMAPVIAPFVFWGVIIGGIILVLDDLWVTFAGGKSVIREVIDGLWGVGTTAQGVKELKGAWDGFKDGVITVLPYLREAWTLIKSIVEKGAAVYGKTLGLAARAGGAIGDLAGKGAVYDAETAYTLNNPNSASSRGSIAARAGALSGGNQTTVIVNAANADAREVARLVDEKVNQSHAANNRAAAQSLTSEAP